MGRISLGLSISTALLLLLVGPAWAQDAEPGADEPASDDATTQDAATSQDEEVYEPETYDGEEEPTEPASGIADELETIEDLLDLIDTWDGGADELQTTYDGLKPELRAMVDENFESWALEGGIGLGAGYEKELAGDKGDRPLFSTNLSVGMTWPVGDYALPIYYAVPDIPGPWALGWNTAVRTDNFNAFGGSISLHWAYEYIGTTPFFDIGPAVRYRDELAFGGRALLGYGNILLQGYVESEYTVDDNNTLTVVVGVRVPWLLFTLI
jgi:hypothetical protein